MLSDPLPNHAKWEVQRSYYYGESLYELRQVWVGAPDSPFTS